MGKYLTTLYLQYWFVTLPLLSESQVRSGGLGQKLFIQTFYWCVTWIFYLKKKIEWELSNVRSRSCSGWEMGIIQNGSCPVENIQLGVSASGSCPSGSCFVGSCPGGSWSITVMNTEWNINPFVPTVAFSQLSSNMCCPRDWVSRHNGGASGAPIMGGTRVPPLNPSETIVLSEHYRLWGV